MLSHQAIADLRPQRARLANCPATKSGTRFRRSCPTERRPAISSHRKLEKVPVSLATSGGCRLPTLDADKPACLRKGVMTLLDPGST